jgi:hypothetical protein
MRYLIASLVCASLLSLAGPSDADLRVSIKQGTTVLKTLSTPSPAGQTTTLFLLSCATPPCSQSFASNFKIEDISATSRARIVKTDGATVDKIELKGIKVTALGSKTLVIEYSTDAGDLTATAGNLYPYTAALVGSLVKSTGGASAQCTLVNNPFCVKLEVRANNNTINVTGSESLASVSVPPITTLTGAFPAALADSENIDCGTLGVAGSCTPFFTATLTAKMNLNDKLTLPGSAINASSTIPVHQGGLIDICVDPIGDELGCANAFVSFTASAQSLLAVPKSPRANTIVTGRSVNIAFDLQRPTEIVPADSISMIALGTPTEISDLEDTVSSRSYVAFIPDDLKPNRITNLTAEYDVIVDGDFVDCSNASLRFEITFEDRDPKLPAPRLVGPILVPLGLAPDFKSNCKDASATLSGFNLLLDTAKRVDETGILNGKCCSTLLGALRRINGVDSLRVRSVALVLKALPDVDQKVELKSLRVNDFEFEPVATTGFACDTAPKNGRTFLIRKLTGPGAGDTFLIPDASITTSGKCQLKTTIQVATLNPDPATDTPTDTQYTAELCVSGRCIPEVLPFTVRTK